MDKNESSNDEREEKRANDEREQPEEREYQQCWSQFVTFPPEAIVGVRFVTVVGDVEGPLCRAYIISVVENCSGVDIIGDE